MLQAHAHDDSVVTTAVLSVLGSVFLAEAIVAAARRPPPRPDHHVSATIRSEAR